MDEKDEQILEILKGNARMSYQELGDQLGISRVAAKKRVDELVNIGIIRGYNTCIYKPADITVLIDIITKPGRFEDVLKYVSTRTAFIRQIFSSTRENHIHMVAVTESARDYNYLSRMILKRCGDDIEEIHYHAVKEVIKDVYGGIRYDQRTTVLDREGDNEKL